MSTDVRGEPHSRPRIARQFGLAALIIAAATCTTGSTSYRLSDICGGHTVAQYLTVAIDTLSDDVLPENQRLLGMHYDVLLNLFNIWEQQRLFDKKCTSMSGEANLSGSLPDLLQRAVMSSRQTAHWNVLQSNVEVDLNPGVPERSLAFTLPLDGTEGSWLLIVNSRVMGRGRLLIRH